MKYEIETQYSIAINFWENAFEFDSQLNRCFDNFEDAINAYIKIIKHDYKKIELQKLAEEINEYRIEDNLGDDMDELFRDGTCAVFFYFYIRNNENKYEGSVTIHSSLYFENNEITISKPDLSRICYDLDDDYSFIWEYIEANTKI